MEKKEVAIIGAGISGLLACKYCLSKGFHPVVFEPQGEIGGVWAKGMKTTRLQAPKVLYQFSDYPWPSSVTEDFPTQKQLLDYLRSYATHFDLLKHIKFHSRVEGISYDGPLSDEETQKWSFWNGNGETFPSNGKWNVTVYNIQNLTTEAYDVDFVILCVGRFKDFPNIPEFAPGKGPDVYQGIVIHSAEYAAMDHETAAEFVKGKKVAVIGFGKTGLDIARECSLINGVEHPCTIVYRKDRWKLPDWCPWGIPITYLYFNRFSELLVHKPGEGFLLSLLANVLSPLRWGISKLVESHIKRKTPLAKFGMVPKQRFSKDTYSSLIAYMPDAEDFFDEVEKGSIRLKKTPSFSFNDKGILIDGENTAIEVDRVILATGFKGIQKLKSIFKSPELSQHIAPSPDSRVPLYREIIHPRIPQLAVIGFSEALSNLYISEMRCRWLADLLEGAFKLPSIKEMERDTSNWDQYMKQSSGEHYQRSSVGALEIWYNDQLCKDIGWNPKRKKGFLANLFEPHGPMDYAHA